MSCCVKICRAAVLVGLLLVGWETAHAQQPVRQASIYSQHKPNGTSDYAGLGANRLLRGGTWNAYAVTSTTTRVELVRIEYVEPGSYDTWQFFFSTLASEVPISVGVYESVIEPNESKPCTVGISVGGPGRDCGHLTGRLEILAAEFDYNVPANQQPRVVRFSAKFEQYCEGSTLGMFGSVYYDAPVVPSGPVAVVDSVEYVRGTCRFNSTIVVRGKRFGPQSTLLIDGQEAFFNQFDPKNPVTDGEFRITRTYRLSPGTHTF